MLYLSRSQVLVNTIVHKYLLFNLLMIELTTGIAFLVSSMYGVGTPAVALVAEAATSTSTTQIVAVSYQDRKSVEKYLRKAFSETPILVEVARCESTFTQFKDGKPLRGNVDKADVGVMQINERYHAESADKLGYDIHTIEGNVAYAKHLYAEQGLAPWKASQKCWAAATS